MLQDEGKQPVDRDAFRTVTKTLMRWILNVQREAVIAQAFARLAAPSLPEETLQEARRLITADYEVLLRSVDQAPEDDVFELLRRFE